MKIVYRLMALIALSACSQTEETPYPVYDPVTFDRVTVTSDFWKAKIDSIHENGIPGCFESCDHSLVNFDIAAGLSDSTRKGTEASDSDVYKIIQGAAHVLDHRADPQLEAYIDGLIDRIAAAQEADGYLHTYWSINDLSQRWTQIKTKHELYCAGHLFEAAADYYAVTGKTKLLKIATDLADHIDSVFGIGKLEEVPGHQEIELALIRLFEVTDEERYLKLAAYFLEERGNPERLAREVTIGENDQYSSTPKRWLKSAYRQDHLPVKEQYSATGHAVRAAYLYRGMADYARTTHSHHYDKALASLWEDIVNKKIYITGSIGTAQFHDEGFGSDYNLPNATAYCETCSAIALMYWNQSMASLTGESRFADLFELTLYNGGLSGGSAGGDRFFYTNPLEGNPEQNRQPWYEPGCCPSNFVRFIPMIDQFIYGETPNEIYVNQFVGSEMEALVNGVPLNLIQETDYPWDGEVKIGIYPERKVHFTLKVRIPGWIQGQFMPGDLYQFMNPENDGGSFIGEESGILIQLNGDQLEVTTLQNGYLEISRKWSPGDQLKLHFPLEPKLVVGRPEIEAVAGQQALTRGPVVYCLEGIDNPDVLENPENFQFSQDTYSLIDESSVTFGIYGINGFMFNRITKETKAIHAIPYFAWRNQGPTSMRIWF